MIRLVRDLSQKAGKRVELQIIGEQTEVDKSVIEQITDPLVHILRNAIDHGIDLPAEREAAGKPVVGQLTIEAKYVGGEVWLSVIDDGRGLNREKILAKAKDRGLLEGDGSDLSDDALWQFIFLPGFSTADKVTDVSGRGVGMDVVRRNIEGIRGKVEIRSKTGKGTTITMRIPLTLAIIDGMVARVGSSLYTIPTIDIQKSLRALPGQITRTPDGNRILNLRGKMLPVVDLGEKFGMESTTSGSLEAILVVVENDGRSVCLGVDELLGQQQIVIKGLSSYIGELTGISGCTILGGGEISLIIDTAGLINSLEAEAA
jgi:two-component system chemotaxis sensor kinase CheA